MRVRGIVFTVVGLALSCLVGISVPVSEEESPHARIRKDAEALRPIVKSDLARSFLAATAALPEIGPRKILRDASRTTYYTEQEAAKLPETERAELETLDLDGSFYYNTRYGSPLAYARPLDLVAAAGLDSMKGKKVIDFGYGTIGHLRLLAEIGAQVTGVEVDPLLQKLYSWPGDQEKVKLLHGHFPGDADLLKSVGGGYSLFISKNVLKNGYIHPAREVDPKRLVHLGVSDEAFVEAIAGILEPGGIAMIYNLHPPEAPPDKPYIPWADGRCPFARGIWEKAGFEVLEFDKDDTPAAHAMAHALGWDAGENGMNLEKDLFATWTMVRKRTP